MSPDSGLRCVDPPEAWWGPDDEMDPLDAYERERADEDAWWEALAEWLAPESSPMGVEA